MFIKMAVRSIGRKQNQTSVYNHASWERSRRLLKFLLRTVGRLLLKIETVNGLENLPSAGPGIIMMNHIAFVDPIVVIRAAPRHIVPLAKQEAFEYPVVGFLPHMWGAIAVRREAVDLQTLRSALQVLKAGELILVAPEGTRGPALRPALEGFAYLALKSGAPVIPVAIGQTDGFPSFPLLPRWWQAGATVTFGRPFQFRKDLAHEGRQHLRQMTDEAMYILAEMLPPERRGVYHDLSLATRETVQWI